MKIGFIGLGRMGQPIAHRISHKFPVQKWSRRDGKCITHLSQDCDTIITCLPTSLEVKSVVHDLLVVTPRFQTLIDCTSGYVESTRDIGHLLKEQFNIDMLDAPVSGGPRKAHDGTLCAMVGGDKKTYEKHLPLLQSFSSPQYVGSLGSGCAIKSINNMLNVSQLCLVSAGMYKLQELGIDITCALNTINHSSGRSLITEERFPHNILNNTYDYGFSNALMKKDLDQAIRMFGSDATITPVLHHIQNIIALSNDAQDYTTISKLFTKQ